jgi:outer membrane biosynthesis protein TonB
MKASDSKHLLLLFLLPIQTLVSSSRVPLLLVVVVWLIRLPPAAAAAAAMTPTRSNNAKTVKREEEEETTPAQEPKPITHNKTNKQSNQRRRCFTTYLPTLLRNYYLPKGA